MTARPRTSRAAPLRYTLRIDPSTFDTLAPGKHSLGALGLYFVVHPSGSRAWSQRLYRGNSETWTSLGRWPEVQPQEAIDRAEANRRGQRDGRDPVADAKAAAVEEQRKRRTLSDVLAELRAAKEPGLRPASVRTMRGRHRLLEAGMGTVRMVDLDEQRIAAWLRDRWLTTPEQSRKFVSGLAAAWAYAAAAGYVDRQRANPARLKGGLLDLLPRRPREQQHARHFRAAPWQDMPKVWAALEGRAGMGVAALRLVVLTGARTAEAIGASWDEIDLDAAVWRVPAERMKAGRAHATPLSTQAVALLRELEGARRSQWVFWAMDASRHTSNMSLLATLTRCGLRGMTTTHGVRSAIRSWAADQGIDREVAESLLAHQADRTERSYQRSDLLERKRPVLQAWADFVTGGA